MKTKTTHKKTMKIIHKKTNGGFEAICNPNIAIDNENSRLRWAGVTCKNCRRMKMGFA